MGFLRNTNAALQRELHRLRHQPMYFVLLFMLPMLSFVFFAVLFHKGVARDIPVASSTRTIRRSRARSPR